MTVIPIKEMNFNLNKGEFRDAIKLRYDWEIADLPAMCACEDLFTVDHAMVCRHGGLIIQRHNEIRELEAEKLRMVCTCLLYTSPSPRDQRGSRMPSSA